MKFQKNCCIAGTLFLLILLFPSQGTAQMKNPISTFFSNLLDETQAEVAVGEILEDTFRKESALHGNENSIATDAEIIQGLSDILALLPAKPQYNFRVMILKNPIPGEIPFPGGLIVLTSGLLELASSKEEKNFILARNVMHISLRHPLTAMKRESLYARALKILKKPIAKRDQNDALTLLQDYIKAISIMDQQRADREAIQLFQNNPQIVEAAIKLLEKCTKAFWAALPWDWHDFSGRIESLKAILNK
ncbi:MAG: M48 family metalloprotease [Candidatus Riflebacteria bacterium]|nr:M48 family metalloprotease [Candidatus Riflebacteria bacterium]